MNMSFYLVCILGIDLFGVTSAVRPGPEPVPDAPVHVGAADVALRNRQVYHCQENLKPSFFDCSFESAADNNKLMMLLANGMETNALKNEFHGLLQRHPKLAKGKKTKDLQGLVFWDSCFMKDSVWNKDYNLHDLKSGGPGCASWEQLRGDRATVDIARPFFYAKSRESVLNPTGLLLEDWGCENMQDYLEDLGMQNIRPVSLIDMLATPRLKTLLFQVATQRTAGDGLLDPKLVTDEPIAADVQKEILKEIQKSKAAGQAKLAEITAMIQSADVIAFNGGNPDLHAFGLGLVGQEAMKQLFKQKAEAGTVITGRSAGGMILSSAIISFEPEAAIFNHFLFPGDLWKDMTGLGLVGDCALRPHYNENWYDGSMIYQQKTEQRVARIRNDEGLLCVQGVCIMLEIMAKSDADPQFSPGPEATDACSHVANSPCTGRDTTDTCVMQWRICMKEARVDAMVRTGWVKRAVTEETKGMAD